MTYNVLSGTLSLYTTTTMMKTHDPLLALHCNVHSFWCVLSLLIEVGFIKTKVVM